MNENDDDAAEMLRALIVPGIGIVVLRADGSVRFTNRDRLTHVLDRAIVDAIYELKATHEQR